MPSDEELIERWLDGGASAARALIERHQHMVYNLACRMLRDKEEAADAAQEVFLSVFRSLHRFRREAKFTTYLYRIVRNECLTRSRRRGEEQHRVQPTDENTSCLEEVADTRPLPSDYAETSEHERLIHRAIERLPEKYRLVITLYYLQDLSYTEIAEILMLPLGTVKIHLFRAKALLKKELERYFGENEK